MRYFIVGKRGGLTLLLTSIRTKHKGSARIFAVSVRSRDRRRFIMVDHCANGTVGCELGKKNNEKEGRNEPNPPCPVGSRMHKEDYTA